MVHYLSKHLTNKTIKAVQTAEDDIVYGKVGCSAKAFKEAITGKTVVAAKQQGKYFYLEMNKPPHPVLHLGMTGWMHVKGQDTVYHKQAKEKEATEQEWPPRFMKFILETDEDEVAFVDARRLARIRLVDCPGSELRKTTPLKENGPDPVIDKDILTVQWLTDLMGRKKVPVKALLLDQANISGVGNWVADEVLYQAKIHPEQYCNTFGEEQIKQLHDSLIGVCSFAVGCLADSKQFPETWLMKYRWDKGKKDANILPNGEKIVHLKVGGRTSAIVPSVQKKTAAVAGDVDDEEVEEDKKPKRGTSKRKAKATDEEEADDDAKPKRGRKRKSKPADEEASEEEIVPAKKVRGKQAKAETKDDVEEVPKPAKKGRGKKIKDEETHESNGVIKTEAVQVDGDANEDEKHEEPAKDVKAGKAGSKKAKAAKPSVPGERRSTRTAAK